MSVPDGPRTKKEQKLRHLKKSDDKVFLQTNIYCLECLQQFVLNVDVHIARWYIYGANNFPVLNKHLNII